MYSLLGRALVIFLGHRDHLRGPIDRHVVVVEPRFFVLDQVDAARVERVGGHALLHVVAHLVEQIGEGVGLDPDFADPAIFRRFVELDARLRRRNSDPRRLEDQLLAVVKRYRPRLVCGHLRFDLGRQRHRRRRRSRQMAMLMLVRRLSGRGRIRIRSVRREQRPRERAGRSINAASTRLASALRRLALAVGFLAMSLMITNNSGRSRRWGK